MTQDAKKVIAALKYPVGKGIDFAKLVDVLVFIGVKSEKPKDLEAQIDQFSLENKFKVRYFE